MPPAPCLLFLLLALPAPDQLENIVRRLEEHYNRLETLKASFVQLYRAEERAAVREEAGTVYLKKPGRMRWEYTRPEVKLFISDGKMVYLYAPEDRQVTRMPARESADVRTPLRFLLGRMNLKRSFGRIEMVQDFAPLDPGNSVLRLLPKSQGERFKELRVEVDQQSRIRRLVIYDQDGSRNDFRLTGEEANPRLDPALFRFVIPPGVEVVDEHAATETTEEDTERHGRGTAFR